MPVRAHELSDGGVVLVCSTTNLPLQVSTQRFRDEEQAEWFLASLAPRDARDIEIDELQVLIERWVTTSGWPVDEAEALSIERMRGEDMRVPQSVVEKNTVRVVQLLHGYRGVP